jgi:hypothetical protein
MFLYFILNVLFRYYLSFVHLSQDISQLLWSLQIYTTMTRQTRYGEGGEAQRTGRLSPFLPFPPSIPLVLWSSSCPQIFCVPHSSTCTSKLQFNFYLGCYYTLGHCFRNVRYPRLLCLFVHSFAVHTLCFTNYLINTVFKVTLSSPSKFPGGQLPSGFPSTDESAYH